MNLEVISLTGESGVNLDKKSLTAQLRLQRLKLHACRSCTSPYTIVFVSLLRKPFPLSGMSAPSGLLSHLAPPPSGHSQELASKIDQKKGELLLVGGTVRDLILQKSPHELDVEVRGLSLEQVNQPKSYFFVG